MSAPRIYGQRLLSGRRIRLLSIRPASNPREPIKCESQVFELKNAPLFEALSYAWGSPEPTFAITCNDDVIRVRANLHAAMIRLRRENALRRIWADAICINQDDSEEKSQQIPMMRDIYSQAQRVVVWLGPGDDEQSKMATTCIVPVADKVRATLDALNITSVTEVPNIDMSNVIFTQSLCDALQNFFNQTWFSRVWCVQEVYLSRVAVVYWGSHQVAWDDVGLAAIWITITKGNYYRDVSDPATEMILNIEAFNAYFMYLKPTSLNLSAALSIYRHLEATDLRDKVYGILGLITSVEEAEAVDIDYTKSLHEVYADAVRTSIRTRSELAGIDHIFHPEEYQHTDDIPSWVPRWDRDSGSQLPIPGFEATWPYSASRDYLAFLYESCDPSRLHLSGVVYTTVDEVSPAMHPGKFYATGTHPFARIAEQVLGMSSDDPDDQWRKLARTLTIGVGVAEHSATMIDITSAESQEIFYGAFEEVMNNIYKHSQGIECDWIDGSVEVDYAIRSENYCTNRRMFWTRNGSFGLGPQCMRPGDIVVVLFGGRVPYVLRPHAEDFLLMGQAYVDEIMKGELIGELEAGRVQEQQFCLV